MLDFIKGVTVTLMETGMQNTTEMRCRKGLFMQCVDITDTQRDQHAMCS